MSIAALICGIASVVLGWCYGTGLIPGIVGIILALQVKKTNPDDKKAHIGMILSVIGAALSLLIFVGCIACIICGGAMGEFN